MRLKRALKLKTDVDLQNHVREEIKRSCQTGETQLEHTHQLLHTCSTSCDHNLCACQELESEGMFRDSEVVIAGLSNVYTHYITTYEEYQVPKRCSTPTTLKTRRQHSK